MLARGLEPFYRRALGAPHTQYILVEVLDGDGNVLPVPAENTSPTGGLLILEGSAVTATLNSRVARNAQITVDQSLYPESPDDLLAPYGNRLRITYGIQFADGSRPYTWVIFTGRIQDAVLSPEGTCSVPAADRGQEVAEAGFLVPQNSQPGNIVTAEFQRLISDAVIDPVFGVSDVYTQTVPQLTWDSDRAAAIDEMATTVGSYWYALADGSFVLRRVPWTVPGDPLLTLRDGIGGVLVPSPSRTRDDVYNSITVTSERMDGSVPVFAIAEDTNPTSPTYVAGRFGRRHRTISLQTPQTQGSANTAAQDYLRRSIGLFETWRWEQPVDAALELGDVVSLEAFGRQDIVQVVSGFSIPLDVGAAMSVQAHAQVLGTVPS